jgi:hypothetical protein
MAEMNEPDYLNSIDDFRSELRAQKKPYLISHQLPANKVYFQFEGKLNGRTVIWNTCLRTMENYSLEYVLDEDPMQFIDIQLKNECYILEIALNIRQIDQAIIESTIVMIRKYKRLQIGRHEYGVRSKTD